MSDTSDTVSGHRTARSVLKSDQIVYASQYHKTTSVPLGEEEIQLGRRLLWFALSRLDAMISKEKEGEGGEGVRKCLLYTWLVTRTCDCSGGGLARIPPPPQPELVRGPPRMEDVIYTTSTQYRLFTFTPKQLSELRHATNKAAAEKITESIKSARTAAALSSAAAANVSPEHSSNGVGDAADDEEINCPTAEEELKLVAYYCVKCMQLSDHFKFPSNVKVRFASPSTSSLPLPSIANSVVCARRQH